jgi:hypothetical protein
MGGIKGEMNGKDGLERQSRHGETQHREGQQSSSPHRVFSSLRF